MIFERGDCVIRFIHTGDIHLGVSYKSSKFSKAFAEKRRAELFITFYRLLDYIKDNGIEYLLIAGDLFEDHIPISKLKEINEKFKELESTQILMIAGNHDNLSTVSGKLSAIDWAPNVHLFSQEMDAIGFDEHQIDFYGISWEEKIMDEQRLNNLEILHKDYANILLAHGDANGKSKYMPVNTDSATNKGIDYIALGHIHKHEYLTKTAAYCGSLEPLDFSEQGEHGFIYGEIFGKRIATKFIPFSLRRFEERRITVNETMSIHDIYRTIKQWVENEPDVVFRIIIDGYREIDTDIDINYLLEGLYPLTDFIDITDHTLISIDMERVKEENLRNIIGQYIQKIESFEEDEDVKREALFDGVAMLLEELKK